MKNLTFPIFGPSNFYDNLREINKKGVKEAKTSESIALASLGLGYIKSKIFNTYWLQLGRMVKSGQGIYINPFLPLEKDGRLVIDPRLLREQRDAAKKVCRGLRLGDNTFSFVEYGFDEGSQELQTFVRGTLARGLEHNLGNVAANLEGIGKTYSVGVNLFGCEPVKDYMESIACLGSYGGVHGFRLDVGGGWLGNFGFAFGVSPVSEADACNESK